MRHRSGVERVTSITLKSVAQCSAHPGTASHNYVGTTNGQTASSGQRSFDMWGSDIPNFHVRKARGELLPFGTYLKDVVDYEASYDMIFGNSGDASQRYYTKAVIAKPAHIIPDMPGINSRNLVQRAAAGLRRDTFDATTFAGELFQTVNMFRNIPSKIVDIARGKRYGGPFGFQYFVDDYLESRYGWRTLRYDIEDVDRAIQRLANGKDLRKRNKSSATDSFTESSTESRNLSIGIKSSSGTGTASLGVMQCQVNISTEVKAKGICIADYVKPVFSFSAAKTAWELTTLSFALDWVWNVGQALDAVQVVASSGGVESCISTLSRSTLEGTLGSQVSGTYPYISGTIVYRSVIERRTRNALAVPLTPQPQFNLDLWKGADLFGLLHQRVRSRARGAKGRYDQLW
jgi:hypothetical protein